MKSNAPKILTAILLIALFPQLLWAQGNAAPARIAIVSESAETSTVSDLLTAELSHKPELQLLERDQIAKVYREQALSAGNQDYLKLGQTLGADGLLLLRTEGEGAEKFMQVRLAIC